MGRRNKRIAHVMEGIEHRHKSVVIAREIFCCSNTEIDVRNLLLLSVAIRCLDRSRMQIKSTELGFRKRLRHDEGGDAMTASNVRNTSSSAQLPFDAFKREHPILVNIDLITGAKKPLYSAKKAVVMLSPRQTRAGPKTLGDKWLIVINGRNGIETSRHRGRTIWISEHCDLFWGEKKSVASRIIANVSRSSLGTKPFAKLSLMEIGLFGELSRSSRTNISKRCVNFKPVAEYNERSIYGRPEIVDHLPKKLIEGIGAQ